MKTFPLIDQDGALSGFEIPSVYFLTSASVSRFFARCPGVTVTKQRKLFERGNEVHAELILDGAKFIVWEPFGDNSRFWVGPSDESKGALDGVRKIQSFVSTNWPGPVSRAVSRLIPWHR